LLTTCRLVWKNNSFKKLLDKFKNLEYTTFIYFDGKENFDIRMPSESRWLVQTGGAKMSFHFPVKAKKLCTSGREPKGRILYHTLTRWQ